jgi:hypothetical protein
MEIYAGKWITAKDLHPVFTIWNTGEVQKDIRRAKRRARRIYKQYLKTGDIRDFNRSQRKISRWDFD